MKNSWERWGNDNYKFFTHMYSHTYIHTCIVYIYMYIKKLQQVKFAYLSYVLRQVHFLVTRIHSSKCTIWEWYYLTKWSHTRLNPQWSSLYCTNNAMMRTTVRLNHNFKENPVCGRHCDGVRGRVLVLVVKDVPLAICCGPNFLRYLTS